MNVDVVAPFTYIQFPSRACGGFVNGIWRVCCTTAFKGVTGKNDYWFDTLFGRWNGPHTFTYSTCVGVGNNFYLGSDENPGLLFLSQPTPATNSVYMDNGVNYNMTFLSASMPTEEDMTEKQIIQSTIELSTATTNATYTIILQDENNVVFTQVPISVTTTLPQWGSAIWGAFLWTALVVNSYVFTIPWPIPVVFQKLCLSLTVPATAFVSVKKFSAMVQPIKGFMNQ
jgi:hypothetical protein